MNEFRLQPFRHLIPHIRHELDRHRLAARNVRVFHLLDDELDGIVLDGAMSCWIYGTKGSFGSSNGTSATSCGARRPISPKRRTRGGRAWCRRRTPPSHADWPCRSRRSAASPVRRPHAMSVSGKANIFVDRQLPVQERALEAETAFVRIGVAA